MSGLQLAYLILVISAFTLYGLVLAWAAWRTRERRPKTAQPVRHAVTAQARRPSAGARRIGDQLSTGA